MVKFVLQIKAIKIPNAEIIVKFRVESKLIKWKNICVYVFFGQVQTGQWKRTTSESGVCVATTRAHRIAQTFKSGRRMQK